MNTPTINQINGRIAGNSTIQYFLQLNAERESYAIPYSQRNYRSREYNFCSHREDGTKDIRRVSITGNFLFIAALKELRRITGASHKFDGPATRYGSFELSFNDKCYASFNVRLVCSVYHGVCIEVESYNSNVIKFERHQVRSNATFAALDYIAYFEKYILSRYYFAPGLFRNIQLVYNLQKSEVAAKYKAIFKTWNERSQEDTEDLQYKAIVRRLLKRKNLNAIDSFIPLNSMIHVLNSPAYPRQKKRRELQPMPNPFLLLEQLSNDYDDEDQIMNEAENIIMDNSIVYI